MDTKELLITGGRELGVSLSDGACQSLEKYMELLLSWNEKFNLTAIVDREEIIAKHFLDSISLLPHIPDTAKNMLDVGSGAGFPGIPLAVLKKGEPFSVTCMDSTNKKVSFLDCIKESLELEGLTNIFARAEEFALKPPHREGYDVVASRAVSRLVVLAELCLPFVSVSGRFLAMKNHPCDQEIYEAREIIRLLGGNISSVIEVNIPRTAIKHSIIVIDKVSHTPLKYPRKYSVIIKKAIS